jgi:spermidine synthase
MGVGSYLAKFIKGNLIDKFVEIEILVGIRRDQFSGTVYPFHHNGSFRSCSLPVCILYRMSGRGRNPLLMNILKDRIGFKDLVSNVFAFDYIGALLASILFPLVLIPHLGIVKTLLFFV